MIIDPEAVSQKIDEIMDMMLPVERADRLAALSRTIREALAPMQLKLRQALEQSDKELEELTS